MARAGFEPATFHFSGERCYQLSYLAKSSGDPRDGSTTAFATPTGLEPATSAVTGRRANQLRYGALPAQAHPSGRPRNYSAGVGPARTDIISLARRAGARHAIVAAVASPSSSGLGHRPFKAAARVRIPLGIQDQTVSDQA